MNHYKLPEFLSNEKKIELRNLALDLDYDDYYHHVSSVSGKLSPLNFYELKGQTFLGKKTSLMMMLPNHVQDWHTDVKHLRTTVLIYPLTDNYAPCCIGEDKITYPALINVQEKHAVFNNDSKRVNFQVSFIEPLDECIEMFNRAETHELVTS
jgi:hypothetical protein